MNEIITQNEVTITSLEIAELTGKQHKNVVRDIKEILGKIRNVLEFELIYKDSRNRDRVAYRLPKIEALILVSGYSVELRAAIIERLDYLEKQINRPRQLSLKESLLLNLQLVEENERLQLENQRKADKIDNYESAEAARRSKQELATRLNRTIRKFAQEKFNSDYKAAYNYVFKSFADTHCINEKINMEFLKRNTDYLAECLIIATKELQ